MINRYIIFVVSLLCTFLSFSQENCDSDVIPCDFPCTEYVTDDNGCPACECSDGWTPINEDGCYDSNSVTYYPGDQFFITECEYVTCLQVEDGWGGFLDSGIWSEVINLDDCVDSENEICPNMITIPSESYTFFDDNLNQIDDEIILLPVLSTGDMMVSSYQFNFIYNHQIVNVALEVFDIVNNADFYNLYDLNNAVSDVSNGGIFSANSVQIDDSSSILSVAYATNVVESMSEILLYIPLIINYSECFDIEFSDGNINEEYIFQNQNYDLLISNQDLSECAVGGTICFTCSDANTNMVCDELEISGCTNEIMFNYNSNATLDDGSCLPFLYGCLDEIACNYNSDANTDNDNCIFEGDTCFLVVNSDCCCCGVCDCVCEQSMLSPFVCEGEVTGSYDPPWNIVLEGQIENCECSAYQFSGCTDTTACNYDENALVDDGSCEYILSSYCDCNGNIIAQNDTTICLGEELELSVVENIQLDIICDVDELPDNLEQDLVTYYPFCGNANDQSINNYDGVVSGALLTTDRFGNENSAYYFDGISNEIEMNTPMINLGDDYTLSIMFNSSDVNQSLQSIFNTIPHNGIGIGWNWNYNEQLYFIVGPGEDEWDDSFLVFDEEEEAFISDTWYHLVLVKNGINYSLYLDGDLEISIDIPASVDYDYISAFRLGSIGGSEYFNGKLDDFGFWQRALSNLEIDQLFEYDYPFIWSTGETSSTINVSPNENTTYTVVGLINESCSDSITVTLNSCDIEILGCTDSTACNYDSNATIDDGLCIYENSCGNCEDPGFIHAIELPLGWSFFSTYICPFNPNMESLMIDLVDIGELVIVKDENGSVYWPEFSINGIGDLANGKGYSIKVENESILNISGDIINYDYPISINTGWSYLGYLHQDSYPIEDLLFNISSSVLILKDSQGNVYWPMFDINTIQTMNPGEGYQINLLDDVVFAYPSLTEGRYSSLISDFNIHDSDLPNPLNTGNNMTIGIPESAWPEKPHIDDKILIYDSNDMLVGQSHYRELGTVITVWGDDLTTDTKDGLSIGEKFKFKLINSDMDTESKLMVANWDMGHDFYTIDGISIAENIIVSKSNMSSTCNLYQNIPNPFNETTTIKFYVSEQAEVSIKLYNVLGECVKELTNHMFNVGNHELVFNSNGLSQGTYFLRMTTEGFTATKHMSIFK